MDKRIKVREELKKKKILKIIKERLVKSEMKSKREVRTQSLLTGHKSGLIDLGPWAGGGDQRRPSFNLTIE